MKFIAENKKLVVFGIFAAVGILVFHFYYFPKLKQVKSLDAEYRAMNRDLDELYSFLGGAEDLKDNMVKMQGELRRLENAMPNEKDVSNVIKYVNEEAKRFKINVRSVRPSDLEPLKDKKGGNVITISGNSCKCMPLALKVEARYQALGEFLGKLETANTPMITIEKVDIQKDENIKPLSRANIDLIVYLLGK